jgi:16S rRNA (cytosine967-C5)-methyltransferase
MHPNALVELATELLHQVMRFDSPADSIVSRFFRQQRGLGPRERHTLAETVYMVLRRRLLYENLAQSGKGEAVRRLVLLGWQGNAAFLRAALTDYELEWLPKMQAVHPSTLPEKLRHNLPDWLADALKSSLGQSFWPVVNALNESAPLDLRVNSFKSNREDVREALMLAGHQAQLTNYSPWGLRLDNKIALQNLDIFKRGDVEVQDEGSQLLALCVDAKRGEMVADFCAGAGGKTLALGASMRNTGRLYAFDTSGHRLAALKPRLARSGLSNVYPVQLAHERDERIKRLAGKMNRVLVDAPCSGLGTLRRNPDLKWRQSPQSVAELQTKQAAILSSAARLLKPGGRLVYATCSLLPSENEDVAHAFTQEHGSNFKLLAAADVLAKAHVNGSQDLVVGDYLHLWPNVHGTDAFFAAIWERA